MPSRPGECTTDDRANLESKSTDVYQEVAAEAQKLGIKILEMKPVPVVTDLLMTTRSFIKKDEVTVRRFMQGYAAAIQYFVSKREESLSILNKHFPGNQAISVDAMYDAFSAEVHRCRS